MSRYSSSKIEEMRQKMETAEASALFWENRYKTQHQTLHDCEEILEQVATALGAAERDRDTWEARAAGYAATAERLKKELEASRELAETRRKLLLEDRPL